MSGYRAGQLRLHSPRSYLCCNPCKHRKFEVFVAWQIGIVVRVVTRAPLFAKATEEGDLDGNANPYDNDGKYDPTRNIHTQMLAYPNK